MQLQFVRTVLDFSFNEKAKGMKGGLMREKDFKDSQVHEVRDFIARSAMYPHMLNLEGGSPFYNTLTYCTSF